MGLRLMHWEGEEVSPGHPKMHKLSASRENSKRAQTEEHLTKIQPVLLTSFKVMGSKKD